jgi:2-polyprenyl-3-methyl-5-hydroxy-6-metoxy-1,4-benzoquinol methylase
MSENLNNSYFQLRRVDPSNYAGFVLPHYVLQHLPEDKNALIVDFGCGFGQVLLALRSMGYSNIAGVDIDPGAIEFLETKGVRVYQGLSEEVVQKLKGKASFVIASHIIEHFPKTEIISTLIKLRSILKPNGKFLMMVPNAQSFTGAYWA